MKDRNTPRLTAERFDSWANMFTGMGTSRDKMTFGFFNAGSRVSDEEAEVMFHEDDVTARICEGMAEYALRKGIKVVVRPGEEDANKADKSKLRDDLKQTEADTNTAVSDLKLVAKTEDGDVWANVFGGSALLLGVNDGTQGAELAKPLNEEGITNFTHVSVIDRRYLTPLKWYVDPRNPKFGMPETYLITPFAMTNSVSMEELSGNSAIFEIHETRLVIFGGVRTSVKRKQENNGWDDSLLTRINTVLKQFGLSWDMLPHILQDANQAVFKMDGLIDAIAADEQNLIHKRMELIDMSRSSIRAVALDSEGEEFARQPFNWGGIKEPYELLEGRLALAAKQPITMLFGRSPAGENATGESDATNMDSQIEAYQTKRLYEPLKRMVELLLKSKDGPTGGKEPENWDIEFPALRSLTPTQEVDMRAKMSGADAAYVREGILTDDEVAVSRFGPDGWSYDTNINIESRVTPDTPEDLEPDEPTMPDLTVPGTEQDDNADPESNLP